MSGYATYQALGETYACVRYLSNPIVNITGTVLRGTGIEFQTAGAS
jgi:hypothetical protein